MTRNLLPLALLGLIVTLAPQLRADDAADDQAFFDKQVSKFCKLQPKRLTADAISKVFTATFYSVTIVGSDGGSTNATVARTGDDISIVSIPSSTADLPDFVKSIKPEFTLKSDADAKTFQDALDVAYSIDSTFNKDDLNAKAIRHARPIRSRSSAENSSIISKDSSSPPMATVKSPA